MCTELIDGRLDKTLNKIVPLKNKYIEESRKLTTSAKERVKALGESVLSNAESQVTTVLQQFNVGKLAQSLKLEEYNQENTLVLLKDNLRLKRLTVLVRKLQEVLYEIGAQSITFAKRPQLETLLRTLNDRLRLQENLEKVQVYSSVFYEIFKENIYQPSLNYSIFTFESGRNYATLTLEKIRTTEIKKLLPELKEKFSYLKDGAVRFYQDKVVLTVDKETLLKNMGRVKEDLELVVSRVRDFKTVDIRNNSQQIYEQALQRIKDRKEGVKLRYKQVADLVNQKKTQVECSRRIVKEEKYE